MSSVELRRLVGSRPLLADAIYEGTEQAIDEAVQVLRDGLRHPDMSKRLAAAATFCATPRLGGVDGDEVPVEARDIALKRVDS